MDLTLVPGIAPEDARRLREAGVTDVAALAAAPDLAGLSDATGIPAPRLAAFQACALDMVEPAGIAITTVAPFQEMAQTLWRAAEDAQEEVASSARQVRQALADALARVKGKTGERVALAHREAARGLGTLRRSLLAGRGKTA